MVILQRKLAAGDVGLYNCTANTNCDESSLLEYCWSCVYVSPPPSPLLPPPPPRGSGQNHVTPYLVSAVCALGVAFLILTTCGILIRCRWWRRRNSTPPPISGDAVFIDEDQGPVDHPIWRIVTVGLPDSVIQSITAVKYGKGDRLIDGTDCSVCLTEFEEGDDLRLLPKCNHAFHISCIDTWLRSHQNCPLCRSDVVNHSSGEPLLSVSARMENPLTRLDENVHEEDEEEGSARHTFLVRLGGGYLRTAEILKNGNWGKRAISDLGENRRVAGEDFQSVRRTISLDASASSAINKAVLIDTGDGEEKLADVDEGGSSKEETRDSSISRLMKSSTIGRSLQKAPVSMKRSFSSGAKILSSFRRSKYQPPSSSSSSSILPL